MGESRHRLVVGIDFGTTYTGVSYGWSKLVDYSEIFRVGSWPATGSKTETAFKVPTQIAYAPGCETTRWGYQIDSGVPRCALMKLLLDKDARQSAYDDPELKEEINRTILNLPDGKDVQTVTTAFFKQLYNRTMDELNKHYPPEIINLTPIHYWFTMPAIWSDEAQVRTLTAAEKAGFIKRAKKDQAFVITEPEAAAIATIEARTSFGDPWKADESVLICDCGGGTVDLTTYRLRSEDPLELDECCPGEGYFLPIPLRVFFLDTMRGKYGGTCLDRNLRKLLSDRFGDAFKSLGHCEIGQGSAFMDDFEYNKRQFGKDGFSLIPLRVWLNSPQPGVDQRHYDASEGRVVLTETDMVTIFKPVVDTITKLVSNQVRKTKKDQGRSIDYLMLVGGLGSSPYLQKKLRDWCLRHGIRLGSPEGSWGVVAHGAVARGLELATVRTRKCRYHYGVVLSHPFRDGIDDLATCWYCRFTRTWYAPGYMDWSIHKGENVEGESQKPIEIACTVQEGQDKIVIDLKSCGQDDAPGKHDPKIVEDMCPIVIRVSDIDLSKLQSMQAGNGKLQYWFLFKLVVILGHQRGTIAFRALTMDGEFLSQASLDLNWKKKTSNN